MTTRNERVVLELDDRFSGPTARAAVAARLLQTTLDDVRGSSGGVSASLSSTERDVTSLGSAVRSTSNELDQYSGRLGLAARAIAAIGPAAVPIGAVAVPAVAGLSNALGVLALAGGTTLLAMQGVGDTLEALNRAHLKPTAENIQAASDAFQELSPRAQEFVNQIKAAGPALDDLQSAAASGVLDGFGNAFDGFMSVLPEVTSLLTAVGNAVGSIGEMTGDSLRSGEWSDFLAFLTRTAPPAIESLGRSLGDLARGAADLWMAFDPVNTSFLDWLEDSAQSFADWSDQLAGSNGLQEFISYLQTSGPQVADAMGALGNALLQIVEAVAPLGGPTLRIIEALADGLAAIADSPVGTPLLALVSAMSALSLATRGYAAVSTATFGAPAVGRFKSTVAALTTVTSAQQRATLSAKQLAAAEAERAATAKSGLASLGKQAGLLGGLALASTGVADSMGLSNTAMLALTGSLAGPWGAAAGGAVGYAIDLKSSLSGATDAINEMNAASRSGDLASLSQSIADAKERLADLTDSSFLGSQALGDAIGNVPLGGLLTLDNDLGKATGKTDELRAAIARAERELAQNKETVESSATAYRRFTADTAAQALSMESARRALTASREAATETATEFFNLGESLDDSSVSLDQWITNLEKQSAALRDFAANSVKAAQNGVNEMLIGSLQEAGPAGALRLKELANATDGEIKRANRAWRQGQKAIEAYTDAVGGVPNAVATRITADGRQAQSVLVDVDGKLTKLGNKVARVLVTAEAKSALATLGSIQSFQFAEKIVRVRTVRTGDGGVDFVGPSGQGRAGGTGPQGAGIGGGGGGNSSPRYERDDILGNGESKRQATRLLTEWSMRNDRGPKAQLDYLQDFSQGARKALRRLERSSTAASEKVDANKESVQRETNARDELVQQFNGLVADIAGQFRTDLFEPMSDVWSSMSATSDPIGRLQADIASADQFSGLYSGLQARGASGDSLTYAAQQGSDALATLSAYTDDQLRQYGSLFAEREQRASAVGTSVAQAQYGAAVAAQNVKLDTANAELATANANLAAILAATSSQTRVVEAAGQAQEAATDRISKSAAKGKRSQQRRRRD